METLNIATGIFLIVIGFLVKSIPNLIAGYNTMSKEKKKNVDIKGLSTFLRNGFIAMGLSIIAGHFVFKWMGYYSIVNSIILIVIVIGVIIIVINAQQFDHNKNQKIQP